MKPSYLVYKVPNNKRSGYHDGPAEEHFYEGAVMLAYAMHLVAMGAREVKIHPDGMHAKGYNMEAWMKAAAFRRTSGVAGRCAGSFKRRGRTLHVTFRSGVGDVVAKVGRRTVIAECKGGIVNTRHNGQLSKLRRGLCEAVGQLIGRELGVAERHVAVVPYTTRTHEQAKRIARRAKPAGIEIALVKPSGQVLYVDSEG
jgi:hypothetical protein